MELNADFSQRALVHGAAIDWQPSPIVGVERRMLERIGEEKARATSIVRYAPGSKFSPHVHGGGEEFLVLEGVFQDEHGDYPVGSYVRNPPGSKHTPGSEPGCVILVKLWQFDPGDRTSIKINSNQLPATAPARQPRAGIEQKPLFQDDHEEVCLEQWQPGAAVDIKAPGGLELFVVEGTLLVDGQRLRRWSWLRLPMGTALSALAGYGGCCVWLKTGHLAHPERLTAPAE